VIILLDNYDSFTYNLVQYLEELGAEVTVCKNDTITVDEVILSKTSGIVLSPGPGRPENAGIMNALVRTAAEKIPLLGVCLGHQAIGQVFGAEINYAPHLMHGKTSIINHDKSTLFKGIPQPLEATRYHSLVIERSSLPEDFIVTAWTDDNTIMAIEHKTMPVYGVQFHPESIMTVYGKEILNNFINSLNYR